MKTLRLPMIISALVLAACGGEQGQPLNFDISLNPDGQILTSDPVVAADQPVASQPAPSSGIPSTDTPSTAAPSTSTPTTTTPSTVVPTAGTCIDTEPFNDGWGWNGVGSCPLAIIQPQPTTPSPSQWSDRTWNCVSNVPEITARWQLQINRDRTFFDLSRPSSDPLRTGTWVDRGNAGFTTVWSDGRSFDYQSLGAGFIDDGGSRCHEDFYPARADDEPANPPAAEQTVPELAAGEWHYPVFFCKAWSDPSNVWAWGFSENGHLRDHNRIIAGSYLFQSDGLQMFITNQFGEQTQWTIVDGESMTISWGGCALAAGPTLREVDLSANTSDYCLACH